MNNVRHTAGRLLPASLITVVMLLSPILASPALADIIADPGGPYTGVVGENVQLRGSAHTDGGRVSRYQWDFGDLTSGSSPAATINHKYPTAGEFTVTLTVVDIDGFTSQPVTTTAAIAESTTTTTTTMPTTTTAGSSSTTSTTSTTTTTTTSSTSTTSTTGAGPPTTPSLPKSSTSTTSPTTSTTATTVESESAGRLSATVFSSVPATISVGGEVALTVVLEAGIPGMATVQFLLEGEPLGEMVTLDAQQVSAGPAVGAVFTRTLPSDLQSGSYRVELATTERPPQVLASLTIEVVAAALPAQDEPNASAPSPISSTRPGLIVAIAVGGAVAVPAVGFGVTTMYRRRTIVRRIGKRV